MSGRNAGEAGDRTPERCREGLAIIPRSTSVMQIRVSPLATTSTVAQRSMSTLVARVCVWAPQCACVIPTGGVTIALAAPAIN